MALVCMKDLLARSEAQHRATGAFNVSSIEMARGVIAAAEATGTPVIMQAAESRLATTPLPLLGRVMVRAAEEAGVDIAVHLDHGATMDCVKTALDLGFTSVMFDGSSLPKEENIAKTRTVVELARQYGAAVEGEIGHLGRTEDGEEREMCYTEPADAIEFAAATEVDALAVAIGNAHGVYAGTPVFHFEVLRAIREKCATPLVLHGGTGSSADNFRRSVENGVRKINIATAIYQASARAAQSVEGPDWFAISRRITEAVENVVKEHILLFGTDRP